MRDRQAAVVVGAGHAGGCAVQGLRAAGWRGPIMLVGTEPDLPYERPYLSKGFLIDRAPIDSSHIAPPSFYREQDIDLRLDVAVTEIDIRAGRLRLSKGGTVPYDRLLLTTGAYPRRFTVPGAESNRIYYLRTRSDAIAIKRHFTEGSRILIVGGGFIGLEVAASASKCGCRVSVLEQTESLMGRLVPREIGDLFADLHRSKGIDIRYEAIVTEFEPKRDGVTAVCIDGSRLDADAVIVGIGAVPATGLAESAGIHCANGIVVDEYCHTSVVGVYAAGDVARRVVPSKGVNERLENWQNAQDQALAAARSMSGATQCYEPTPYIWSDQFDSSLQIAGRLRADDRLTRGSVGTGQFLVFYFLNMTLVGVVGVNSPREFSVARRLLGHEYLERDRRELGCPETSLKRFLTKAMSAG